MIKELGIIFAVMGCIFLWLPLDWLFPTHILYISIFTTSLLVIVLAYAALDVKKLVGNNQRRKAGAFVAILVIAFWIALFVTALVNEYYYFQHVKPFG